MGSSKNIQQVNGRPAPPPLATSGLNEPNGHSRSGSFNYLDGKASGPASASSSNYSALSFAMGLRQPQGSTPDPSSAISSVYSDREGGVQMERDNSVNGLIPDLDKLSLEKGRPLDVDDLDDEGWLAASEQKKIVELGSLGEGAGGAVTRCKLKEGKTVFALKVGLLYLFLLFQKGFHLHILFLLVTNRAAVVDYHNRPQPRCKEADCSGTQLQQGLCLGTYLSILRCIHGQVYRHDFDCDGVLRGGQSRQYLQRSEEARGSNRRESAG